MGSAPSSVPDFHHSPGVSGSFLSPCPSLSPSLPFSSSLPSTSPNNKRPSSDIEHSKTPPQYATDILVTSMSSPVKHAYPLDPQLAAATIPAATPSPNLPDVSSCNTALKPHQLHPFRQPSLQPFSPKVENGDDHMQSPTRASRSLSLSTEPSTQTTASSVSHKRTHSHPHALVDVPEWEDKPSAEEYKMFSSKEKRQLRNKISARNFRHRRKGQFPPLLLPVGHCSNMWNCVICADVGFLIRRTYFNFGAATGQPRYPY